MHGARQAGQTVGARALQLWKVGAGLPLDALKKNAIVEWKCPYELSDAEVSPLLDALSKNSSLVHLDLSGSGLKFGGANASGAPLISRMASSAAALGGLRSMTISQESGFSIPIARLRAGRDEALAALSGTNESRRFFFTAGGPRREELLLIGDLLRKNSSMFLVGPAEEKAAEAVTKLLGTGRKGKLSRESWEEQVVQLMVGGCVRRGHLKSLFAAEALRDVGFKPDLLRSMGYVLAELRVRD